MARKIKPEEHVNHERWLVSYADFITLLFAFFTALYAMSNRDSSKASKLIYSTRLAFNIDVMSASKHNNSMTDIATPLSSESSEEQVALGSELSNPKHVGLAKRSLRMKLVYRTYKQIKELIDKHNLPGMSVRTIKNAVVISLLNGMYFNRGEATLLPQHIASLDKLGQFISNLGLEIRIEGHAGDEPNRRYKSRWALSVARAMSVGDYLLEQFGFPPDKLSVAGYAAYRPAPWDILSLPAAIDSKAVTDPNAEYTLSAFALTPARNQRVDVVLLPPRSGEDSDNPTLNDDYTTQPSVVESSPPAEITSPDL